MQHLLADRQLRHHRHRLGLRRQRLGVDIGRRPDRRNRSRPGTCPQREVTLDNNVFTSTNCALSPEGAPAATTTIPAVAPVLTVPAPVVTDITLPRTGSHNVAPTSTIGGIALILGAAAIVLARRRRPAA
jgi:LPXTG-motif cell wall-anchored protein